MFAFQYHCTEHLFCFHLKCWYSLITVHEVGIFHVAVIECLRLECSDYLLALQLNIGFCVATFFYHPIHQCVNSITSFSLIWLSCWRLVPSILGLGSIIIQILTGKVMKYHVSVDYQESYIIRRGNITILAPPTHDISSVPVNICYIRWSNLMISSTFDGALWLPRSLVTRLEVCV